VEVPFLLNSPSTTTIYRHRNTSNSHISKFKPTRTPTQPNPSIPSPIQKPKPQPNHHHGLNHPEQAHLHRQPQTRTSILSIPHLPSPSHPFNQKPLLLTFQSKTVRRDVPENPHNEARPCQRQSRRPQSELRGTVHPQGRGDLGRHVEQVH
jgi:hypothetical protein